MRISPFTPCNGARNYFRPRSKGGCRVYYHEEISARLYLGATLQRGNEILNTSLVSPLRAVGRRVAYPSPGCVSACVHVHTCGPHGGVCTAVRGTRGTLYEWNVSTPSVAREAPVCPACKHNNTDVSIHQVDPGGAERPREMPLEAPRELCTRPCVCVRVCAHRPPALFFSHLSFLLFLFFFTPSPTLPRGYLKGDSDLGRAVAANLDSFIAPRGCFRIRESRGRLGCAIWRSLNFLRF